MFFTKDKLINWLRVDVRFLVVSGLTLLIFAFLDAHLLVQLTQESFFKESFIVDIVLAIPLFFVGIACLLILNYLPIKYNKMYQQWTWDSIDSSGRIRVFVFITAIVIAWSFAGFEYNFYYDQPHYVERLILFGLMIAVWFTPLAVGPLVVIAYATSSQLLYPAEVSFSYVDKVFLFNFLLIFACFSYIRPLIGGKYSSFIYLVIIMVGAFYLAPFQAKVTYDNTSFSWVFDNDLHNLVMASYLNGWLIFLPEDVILQLTKLTETLNIPLQAFTLAVELFPLFLLFVKRRLAMVGIVGAIILHLGIFVASGTFFWKWIVLDTMLVWYLWRTREDKHIQSIFHPAYGLIGIIIVLLPFNVFNAPYLGWLDSPLNNLYDYEVEDINGDEFEFPRYFMQPYDFRVAQSRLNYLTDEPYLARIYGTMYIQDAYIRLQQERADAFPDIYSDYGINDFNLEKSEHFTEFVLRYFTSYNRRIENNETFLPAVIRPPLHIITMFDGEAFDNQSPIDTVKIRYRRIYYDGNGLQNLINRIALKVDIPLHLEQLREVVHTSDYVLGFTNTRLIKSDGSFVRLSTAENDLQRFELQGRLLPTYVSDDVIRAELDELMSQQDVILLTYEPNNEPTNLMLVRQMLEENYKICETVINIGAVIAQRYVKPDMNCPSDYSPILYTNGISIVDTAVEYDAQNQEVRAVIGWQFEDEQVRNNYNVSLQLVTPDWQNVAQIDKHLSDRNQWDRVALSTAEIPDNDYRVMVIVYHRDTGEKVSGTDLTTGETATLLPLATLARQGDLQEQMRQWQSVMADASGLNPDESVTQWYKQRENEVLKEELSYLVSTIDPEVCESLHQIAIDTESIQSYADSIQQERDAFLEEIMPNIPEPLKEITLDYRETILVNEEYQLDYIVFDSRLQDIHIYTYLLIPKQPPPPTGYPAVVLLHANGDYPEPTVGISDERDRTNQAALDYVRRGAVVLVPHLIVRSDVREQIYNSYNLLMQQPYLPFTQRVMSVVDWLDLQTELPIHRIAVHGLSYGARIAMLTTVADERVDTVGVSQGVRDYSYWLYGDTDDPILYYNNVLIWMDACRWDSDKLLKLIIPHNMYIESSIYDRTLVMRPDELGEYSYRYSDEPLDMTPITIITDEIQTIYDDLGLSQHLYVHFNDGEHEIDAEVAVPWILERLTRIE